MKIDNESNVYNYYKAYDKRYEQVYKGKMLWSSKEATPDVLSVMTEFKIGKNATILDLGCGEGRDAIYLLENGYNVLALDYSENVIEKCKELSSGKFNDRFKQFDLLVDKLDYKFDFIYSVAVLHMFVLDEHRQSFFDFIYNHLSENGVALICILGDGVQEYSSDIKEAFVNTKRTVLNNSKEVCIATTSCRIVNWENLMNEIDKSKLKLEKQWISEDIPEFTNSMCIVVSQKSM